MTLAINTHHLVLTKDDIHPKGVACGSQFRVTNTDCVCDGPFESQAYTDFQQFFLEDHQPYIDLDISRQQKARSKGVPSQILQNWETSRKGGAGQAAWFSQFHQGDWQGPFKGHPQMSACALNSSERWRKSFAPQHVDENILKRICRESKKTIGSDTPPQIGAVRSLSPIIAESSVEVERSRAAKLVKQACLSRKQENENRIQDQIRDREEKLLLRDQANVKMRFRHHQDWVDRCHQAFLSIGNRYGKGYRQPEVRHAFYAPTKIHYYPEGSHSQFDRSMPSVGSF